MVNSYEIYETQYFLFIAYAKSYSLDLIYNFVGYSLEGICMFIKTYDKKTMPFLYISQPKSANTGPCSTVGNVSGYRCEADCRSRVGKFNPGPVPYFRGD